MTDLRTSIAPSQSEDRLLELIGLLGAALVRSDRIADPIVRAQISSAHRLALDMFTHREADTQIEV